MDEEKIEEIVVSMDNMFGAAINIETIRSVVLQCDGDAQESIEELMRIAEFSENNKKEEDMPNQIGSELISYAAVASKPCDSVQDSKVGNLGAIAKIPQRSFSLLNLSQNNETCLRDIERVIDYINEGFKLLILMRGFPGSGKTYLAKYIVDKTVDGEHKTYICSTDDYFMRGNRYEYRIEDLSSAHAWNQKRVHDMLCQGVSPIIVDNTNLQMWEMKPYAASAVMNGYEIEILEPLTPWAKNARELAQKNKHCVTAPKIRQMFDKYESNVTAESLRRTYNFKYTFDLTPPQPRNIPKLSKPEFVGNTLEENTLKVTNEFISSNEMDFQSCHESEGSIDLTNRTSHLSDLMSNLYCNGEENKLSTNSILKLYNNYDGQANNVLDKTVNNNNILEKLQLTWTDGSLWNDINNEAKVAEPSDAVINHDNSEQSLIQWVDCEPWSDPNKDDVVVEIDSTAATPKPQRMTKEITTTKVKERKENFLQDFESFTDWNTIENQWSSFDLNNSNWRSIKLDSSKCNMKDFSSNTHDNEIISFSDKILVGKCREINDGFKRTINPKPPLILKLDKSSMTDDIETAICQSVDHNFITFRNMFMQIKEADLQEIYDRCEGDLSWAVEIVLDGDVGDGTTQQNYATRTVKTPKTEASALKHNQNESSKNTVNSSINIPSESQSTSLKKKDKTISETSLQLKRQLEQNCTFPDRFYSEHCLKIRRMRRGEISPDISDSNASEMTSENENANVNVSLDNISEESDPQEEMVTMHLGPKFIIQIDKLFDMEVDYPDNILPVINMPMSLLQQIHALWIESLTYQIDVQHELSDELLKEDLDFARKLAEKEKEQVTQGLPQKEPNLQEIMDMELAFALSHSQEKSLNDKGEDDLAKRLSKQKLMELFPDMDKYTLFEILEAHDNKFEQTVQVLLLSTGMINGSEDENVVNRLISDRAWKKKQAVLLEEAQQAMHKLSSDDLVGDGDCDMEQAEKLRGEARQHLKVRDRYHCQAQEYFQKGMLDVASYYSQIAALHKKKFDFANLQAANSLIQAHSSGKDRATLDLHHLYVAEALEALDIFLDRNINELIASVTNGMYTIKQRSLFLITGRGLHSRGGPRIKPAVKKRLKQRAIRFAEVNPGLLSVTVDNNDKLTYHLRSND